MRKLIVEEWVSLDGYVAGPNGELDFFPSTEANKFADLDQLKLMEEIDTILLGRITYQLFVDFWPTATNETEIISDTLNSTQKIVFSNTLKKAPWGKWPDATVMTGDAITEIRRLKEKEGKNMVLWGSVSLAQLLIKENLVDELHLQICPTAIGSGRLLFPAFDHVKNFKLIDVKKYGTGVVYVQYASSL